MAESRDNLSVISRLGLALNRCNFPSFCIKPLQVKCFEYLLNGYDVIAVLPTGFGKSLLFQLLPNFLPVKADKNVVIVVCPLNSIMEDQLKVLEERGVTADVLQLASDDREGIESVQSRRQRRKRGRVKAKTSLQESPQGRCTDSICPSRVPFKQRRTRADERRSLPKKCGCMCSRWSSLCWNLVRLTNFSDNF